MRADVWLFGLLWLVPPAPNDPIPYCKDGKWGYADAARHLVVAPAYDEAERFKEGRALVTQGKKRGFIDPQGSVVIPLRYSYAQPFSDGLAAVGLAGWGGSDHFGFVDGSGKVVLPIEYDWVTPFEHGVAKVKVGSGRGEHWGLVDTQGHLIVPPTRYAFVGEYSEDLAPVYEEHTIDIQRFGFVDRQGREVIPISKYYSWGAGRWTEGRFAVRHKAKWGFIDKTGREVIPTIYDDVGAFENGRARVTLSGKASFIDLTGQAVPLADEPRRVEADGLAEIVVGAQRAWVDSKGAQVIPPRYDSSHNEVCPDWYLSDGLRGVTLGERHGFIDSAGVAVIPVRYDCTGKLSEGLAAVKQGELWGFVDKAGTVVIPLRYVRVDAPFENGYALVSRKVTEGRWLKGYIDRQGKEFFEGSGSY